jgi:hypothetical protein
VPAKRVPTPSFGYVRERPVSEAFALPPDADGKHLEVQITSAGVVIATIPRHPCLKITPEAAQLPDGSHCFSVANVAAGV